MNGGQLKVLAMLPMLIDHLGLAFWPEARWLRWIGRLAMPIFVFLLTEGFRHTRSRKKYLLRLTLCGLISEPAFDRFVYGQWVSWEGQSILLGLILTFLCLWAMNRARKTWTKIAAVVLCALGAELLGADYGWVTVALGAAFFLLPREKAAVSYFLCLLAAGAAMGGIQPWMALAAIPLGVYNGEKGKAVGYAWYGFYPVHLLILAFLK